MNVLVTGAGRGIGAAISEAFVNEGYTVYSNYLQTVPIYGVPVQADVSNIRQVERMFSEIPKIDILINNAGVALYSLFQEVTEEQYRRLFEINVYGCFNCAKFAIPYMVYRKSGSIINISSIWGVTGGACEVHYSASKAAVIGFTRALAEELLPSNVNVNAVAPGAVDTDMCKELDIDFKITKEDVASTVLMLAKSRNVTGQVLEI